MCAHSCVGRIRYVGVVLYDADRIAETAATAGEQKIYQAHLDLLLDPHDSEIQKSAAADGIAANVMDAAIRSPIFKLAKAWHLALPLHPEYRTLPMVWYVPPLSPISALETDRNASDAVDRLRIPIKYLANLLSAGDPEPVRLALKRLMAIRQFMRAARLDQEHDDQVLRRVDLSPETAREIYQLLALARYEDRFVLTTKGSATEDVYAMQGCCGFPDTD